MTVSYTQYKELQIKLTCLLSAPTKKKEEEYRDLIYSLLSTHGKKEESKQLELFSFLKQ